ncbi:MAG: hypothetical protein KDB36_13470 [Acidimicrobiales bacterium]|nr:hypothetical protein [Acidimicrobiales bacterium]
MTGDQGRPRLTRRDRRRAAIFAVVVVVVVIGGAAFVLFAGERATTVSDQSALDRFRTEGSSTAGSAGTAAGGDTAGDGTATVGGAAYPAPAPGVYAYTGSGEEVTSFPPLTEQQGPDMPATVVIGADGCWSWRIDLNTHHWQDWTFCSSAEGLLDTGGTSFARRDFVTFQIDNTSTFTCPEPEAMLWPDMAPGQTRTGRCVGTSSAMEGESTSAGTATMVGVEDVVVGGTTVPAVHVRRDHTLSGAQTGTELVEWWLHPDTGLPLRQRRSLRVDTATPVGPITYTEEGELALTSLEPQT